MINSQTVRQSAKAFSWLLGALGISPKSGNAGTGMYRRGAYEHGCEFAPVAGVDKIDIEILSALFKHHAVSNFDERCSASVTALQDSFL